MRAPEFVSAAFDDIPRPGFADVAVRPLPPGATTDPAAWARAIFSARSSPPWVKALFVVRFATAGLFGARRSYASPFAVRAVRGEEALLGLDDRHLDWRCGVGVDPAAGLVRVVTAVRFNTPRGRAYFVPVGALHPLVVRSMMRRAERRLSSAEPRADRSRRG